MIQLVRGKLESEGGTIRLTELTPVPVTFHSQVKIRGNRLPEWCFPKSPQRYQKSAHLPHSSKIRAQDRVPLYLKFRYFVHCRFCVHYFFFIALRAYFSPLLIFFGTSLNFLQRLSLTCHTHWFPLVPSPTDDFDISAIFLGKSGEKELENQKESTIFPQINTGLSANLNGMTIM